MLIYNVVYCYRYNYDHILHGHLELDGHISYTFIIMRPNILRSAVFALKAFVSCLWFLHLIIIVQRTVYNSNKMQSNRLLKFQDTNTNPQ